MDIKRLSVTIVSLLCAATAFAGQKYYSTISINSAQVPSTQTDFPVLVSQTDARFKSTGNGGHVASSSGFDIRPYTDTTLGTAITGYELERYNASTGEVIMWVKVSSLSSSTTPIVLGYGDTTLTTDGSSTTTWSNNFLVVYHLKDGTTLNVNSSTGSNNGTNHGATATSGQVDGAASVASASSQYIDCSSSIALPAAITLSAWVKGTSFPNAYNQIFGFEDHTGGVIVQAQMWAKSTGKLTFFVQCTTSDIGYDGSGSHTLSSGTIYYICMTADSTNGLVGYVNAASDGTAAAGGTVRNSHGASTFIGNDPFTAGRFWNGMLDEVRMASIARTANWITTEYNNQSAPGTFETLGGEVSLGTNPAWFIFFQP